MKVYHGGTTKVDKPLVSVGRAELDFGPGFYVTDRVAQADAWAKKIASKRLEPAIRNEYELDYFTACSDFRFLKFEKYDLEWLDFIASNRKGHELWRGYDLIEGGVADDRVIDTVEAYIAGTISAEAALKNLIMHTPNNQICILNQELVNKCLTFVDAIEL